SRATVAAANFSTIRRMLQALSARPAARTALASRAPRVLSVDVLRGLVMFTMVFVNDIAGGRGLPGWLKHFQNNKQHPSGMTFVDLVFPAFLFIVGMSIPLAIE